MLRGFPSAQVPAAKSKRPTLLLVMGMAPQNIGGMLIITRRICTQLCRRGWNTVVAWEGPMAPAVETYFSGIEGLRFEILPRQEGFRWEHIRGLRRLLVRHRPDQFVYAFNGILRLFPWIARLTGVRRIIYYDHSSHTIGYTPRRWSFPKRLLGRLLCGPISKVTSVSGYPARCLEIRGFYPAEKIAVVYNGVEMRPVARAEGDAFRRRFGIPGDRFLVVQVSWLVPEKGVDVLLQAAAQVLAVAPNGHFAVVGDGPCRPQYEALARQLGISDRVTFTGTVLRPAAEGVFAAADVCCQLSQWEEACPLVVQEAMAAGRPMVASSVGGIPELVAEGETGFLVDRTRPAEAAQRILELLRDPVRSAAMGEAGRQRARRLFDLERNVDRLLAEWEI